MELNGKLRLAARMRRSFLSGGKVCGVVMVVNASFVSRL